MDTKYALNGFLITMTHYFSAFRMPELAIANILALMVLNHQHPNVNEYIVVNGTLTYLMGYTYFLQGRPSSGVYMFLLGVLCIGSVLAGKFQYLVEDWNLRFRVSKEVNVESDSEEDEDDVQAGEEKPASWPPIYQPADWAPIYPTIVPTPESMAPPVEDNESETESQTDENTHSVATESQTDENTHPKSE